MPDLVMPTMHLRAAWSDAHTEWGLGAHEDGFGLLPDDDVESTPGFAQWLARLAEQSDPATLLDEGTVHCSYRWIVEGDRVLGGIALRHELNDFLLREGGHIGYGIRPSERGRGLAPWALGQMLHEANALGLEKVLVVCTEENVASARTIERCGGALEDIRPTERGTIRRYWINTRLEG
jgi:predicted acetyltransferase